MQYTKYNQDLQEKFLPGVPIDKSYSSYIYPTNTTVEHGRTYLGGRKLLVYRGKGHNLIIVWFLLTL